MLKPGAIRGTLVLLLCVTGMLACASTPALVPGAATLRMLAVGDPHGTELGRVTATTGSGCGLFGAKGNYEASLAQLKNEAAKLKAVALVVTNRREPYSDGDCYHNEYVLEGIAYGPPLLSPRSHSAEAKESTAPAPDTQPQPISQSGRKAYYWGEQPSCAETASTADQHSLVVELGRGAKAYVMPHARVLDGASVVGWTRWFPETCLVNASTAEKKPYDASWHGSVRADAGALCMKIERLKTSGQQRVEIGYSVVLSGATFADGSVAEAYGLTQFSGSSGVGRTDKCVPYKLADERTATVPAAFEAAKPDGRLLAMLVGLDTDDCARACEADPGCSFAAWGQGNGLRSCYHYSKSGRTYSAAKLPGSGAWIKPSTPTLDSVSSAPAASSPIRESGEVLTRAEIEGGRFPEGQWVAEKEIKKRYGDRRQMTAAWAVLPKHPEIVAAIKRVDPEFELSSVSTASRSTDVLRLADGRELMVLTGCTAHECGMSTYMIVYDLKADTAALVREEYRVGDGYKLFGSPDAMMRQLLAEFTRRVEQNDYSNDPRPEPPTDHLFDYSEIQRFRGEKIHYIDPKETHRRFGWKIIEARKKLPRLEKALTRLEPTFERKNIDWSLHFGIATIGQREVALTFACAEPMACKRVSYFIAYDVKTDKVRFIKQTLREYFQIFGDEDADLQRLLMSMAQLHFKNNPLR